MSEICDIRPYISADGPHLADAWVAAWTLTFPHIDFEARRPWLHEQLKKWQETGVLILVAHAVPPQDPVILGFVTLDVTQSWLDQLAVAPKSMGLGIGQALIQAAKNRSTGTIHLDVNQDNIRAIRFYEKLGFMQKSTGINPTSGLQTLVMTWKKPSI